jgi:hypothetical protein
MMQRVLSAVGKPYQSKVFMLMLKKIQPNATRFSILSGD